MTWVRLPSSRAVERFACAKGLSVEWCAIRAQREHDFRRGYVESAVSASVRDGANEGRIVTVLVHGRDLYQIKMFGTIAEAWQIAGTIAHAVSRYASIRHARKYDQACRRALDSVGP